MFKVRFTSGELPRKVAAMPQSAGYVLSTWFRALLSVKATHLELRQRIEKIKEEERKPVREAEEIAKASAEALNRCKDDAKLALQSIEQHLTRERMELEQTAFRDPYAAAADASAGDLRDSFGRVLKRQDPVGLESAAEQRDRELVRLLQRQERDAISARIRIRVEEALRADPMGKNLAALVSRGLASESAPERALWRSKSREFVREFQELGLGSTVVPTDSSESIVMLAVENAVAGRIRQLAAEHGSDLTVVDLLSEYGPQAVTMLRHLTEGPAGSERDPVQFLHQGERYIGGHLHYLETLGLDWSTAEPPAAEGKTPPEKTYPSYFTDLQRAARDGTPADPHEAELRAAQAKMVN